MLARPFASEIVPARAVWRLKYSVVAKLTAGPRRSPRARLSAGPTELVGWMRAGLSGSYIFGVGRDGFRRGQRRCHPRGQIGIGITGSLLSIERGLIRREREHSVLGVRACPALRRI